MRLSDHLSTSGCPTDGRYDAYYPRGSLSPRPACGCGSYCVMRAHAGFYAELVERVHVGTWAPPLYSSFPKEVTLQVSNVEITLRPDGTYCLSDTSGG